MQIQDFSSIKSHIASPPGFTLRASSVVPSKRKSHSEKEVPEKQLQEQNQLALKKSWSIVTSSSKSIPMNLLMMYMSGNSLQIFSIFITVMMFWNPVKSIMNMDKAFGSISRATSVNLFIPKLVFIALNTFNMLLALYKCQQMGLLPTSDSDWLAFLPGHRPAAIAQGDIDPSIYFPNSSV